MFIILYGEDDFTIRESLKQIKSECGETGMGEADTASLDGSKVTPDELTAVCNTISFLAPKRIVIVEGLLGSFEAKGKRGKGKGKTPELKQWEFMAKMPIPDSTVLVLLDGKLTKTNPLLKKLAPVAEVRECSPLDIKGKKLPGWIGSRVKASGSEITARATGLLISLIGNDLWVLANEIDKLCLYAAGRRIEEADVNLLVSYAREENVFHLVDAIIQRRKEEALKMLHQHFVEGKPPAYLLFMITSEFRLLLQARDLSSRRMPIKDIAAKIGEPKEWKVEKMLRQAQGYSIPRMERAYRKLLETDLAIKTGLMEGETALDLLVADLCQK
ncbi:MAG: DNA polymerase III subunit delta [Dehalococcoidia bacterium]